MTPEARTRLVEVMAKAISPWAFNTEARGGWWLRHMLGSQRDARNHAENAIAAADMRTRVLAVVLAWAYDRSEIGVNHAARMKRLADASPRSSTIYTEEMEARLLAELPADMRDLYLMALYTGLRRGDLCALTPGAIRAGWLVVVPQKTARSTGAPVHLPIDEMPELARIVSRLPSHGAALLRQASGEPWNAHNLTRRWGRHMDKIGLGRMHFHDIRGTTATRLVAAGCTEAERGAIMGHAISSGSGAAYTARVRELSINAYRKWASAIERGPVVIRAGVWKTAAGK